jgi:hypothetical protein
LFLVWEEGKAIYIFYADVFLVQSCLMNAGILLVARELLGCSAKGGEHVGSRGAAHFSSKRNCGHFLGRLAAVSIAAGTLQLLTLCATGSYTAYLAVSLLLVIPGMVRGMFGRARLPVFLRRSLLCGLVAALLGGAVSAAENLFRLRQIPVWILILSVFMGKEGVRMFRNQMKKQQMLCTVVLSHRGKELGCTALWDTGNRLRETGTNRPVHIISREVYRGLRITAEDYAGLAGYCTLGEEDGILPLYEIDGLRVIPDKISQKPEQGKAAASEFTKAVVACAGERLLAQKPYQVILNVEGAGTQ